jgi:hypothetical protein
MRHVLMSVLALATAQIVAARSSSMALELPPEALVFPADTRSVAALDVKKFLGCPLHQTGASPLAVEARKVLAALRDTYGLDTERDVDRLHLALAAPPQKEPILTLLEGRFDRARIARAPQIVRRKTKDVDVAGCKAITFTVSEKTQAPTAVCVMGSKTVLIGALPAVQSALTARVSGRRPLLTNIALSKMIEQVGPATDFWIAGDAALLQAALTPPSSTAGAKRGPALPGLTFSQVQGILLKSQLKEDLDFALIGETTDSAAALSTAAMVKGLLALTSFSAQSQDLRDLASSVNVSNEGSRVAIKGRVSYAQFERLTRPPKRSQPTQISPTSK